MPPPRLSFSIAPPPAPCPCGISPHAQPRIAITAPPCLGGLINRDRKSTQNLCDKDSAELSGELSGAICLKTRVLLVSALELFREFFGAVHVIIGFVVPF